MILRTEGGAPIAKVRSFESRRGSKRRKKKKTHFVSLFFLLAIFSLFFLLCTSKMISRA
jgi:hypothetical protein